MEFRPEEEGLEEEVPSLRHVPCRQAAASEAAADAGSAVAELGGNAVDVAIAATVASMSTELGIVSPWWRRIHNRMATE